jgi:hypothetical protein
MNERVIDEEAVRQQHLREVNQRNQALYMVAVIGGAFLVMIALISLLGSGG